ncbi:MAG: cupin domain-containing protein [Solirubrobacteraceae bacterium]
MNTSHTKINLNDVKDLAPEYGMAVLGEARFARDTLGAQRIGLARYRVNPGQRIGFGHRHRESEEMYVVLSGSGRFKVEDDVFPVAVQDVVYCPPASMRAWEAGADGLELLAFGGHIEDESELEPGWWTD